MIIDDSVSFFGVYYHNCIFHLNLSKEFADIYSKDKFKNIILCQKDERNGYLMTQSISNNFSKNPNIQSFYFSDKKALKDGYRNLSNKIISSERVFYLLNSDDSSNSIQYVEELVKRWKTEVKNAIQKI